MRTQEYYSARSKRVCKRTRNCVQSSKLHVCPWCGEYAFTAKSVLHKHLSKYKQRSCHARKPNTIIVHSDSSINTVHTSNYNPYIIYIHDNIWSYIVSFLAFFFLLSWTYYLFVTHWLSDSNDVWCLVPRIICRTIFHSELVIVWFTQLTCIAIMHIHWWTWESRR